MATAQIDAVKELVDSFQLLLKNWILAIPTAIVSLLAAILIGVVILGMIAGLAGAGVLGGLGGGEHGSGAGVAALLGGTGLLALVGVVILVVLSLIANATVIYAASDAWAGRAVDLISAMGRAFGKLGHLIVAGIIIFLLAIIPGVLIFVLIGVVLLFALGFFMMYVVPSITLGNRSGTEAIGASFNLAKSNFGPSAIAFIGIFVVALVGAFIDGIFRHWFIFSLIVSFVVGGLTSAYAAIVIVRFYELLSRSPMAPAMARAGAVAPAPPPPSAPTS